jgi:hypothetical protein
MSRFCDNSRISVEQDSRIRNAFVRLLASKAADLGVTSPLISFDQSEFPARVRYAPMQRLLTSDDERFLRRHGCPQAALRLRREHRRYYRQYLANLKREIRGARRLQNLAMASAGHWDFCSLLTNTALSECSMLYLTWLGWKHSAGITGTAQDVTECLNFLLPDPRFLAEAI